MNFDFHIKRMTGGNLFQLRNNKVIDMDVNLSIRQFSRVLECRKIYTHTIVEAYSVVLVFFFINFLNTYRSRCMGKILSHRSCENLG